MSKEAGISQPRVTWRTSEHERIANARRKILEQTNVSPEPQSPIDTLHKTAEQTRVNFDKKIAALTKKTQQRQATLENRYKDLYEGLTDQQKTDMTLAEDIFRKQAERSMAGKIGSLVRYGHLTSVDVRANGSIDIQNLEELAYFKNNPDLLTALATHTLSDKSKIYKIAKQSIKEAEETDSSPTKKQDTDPKILGFYTQHKKLINFGSAVAGFAALTLSMGKGTPRAQAAGLDASKTLPAQSSAHVLKIDQRPMPSVKVPDGITVVTSNVNVKVGNNSINVKESAPNTDGNKKTEDDKSKTTQDVIVKPGEITVTNPDVNVQINNQGIKVQVENGQKKIATGKTPDDGKGKQPVDENSGKNQPDQKGLENKNKAFNPQQNNDTQNTDKKTGGKLDVTITDKGGIQVNIDNNGGKLQQKSEKSPKDQKGIEDVGKQTPNNGNQQKDDKSNQDQTQQKTLKTLPNDQKDGNNNGGRKIEYLNGNSHQPDQQNPDIKRIKDDGKNKDTNQQRPNQNPNYQHTLKPGNPKLEDNKPDLGKDQRNGNPQGYGDKKGPDMKNGQVPLPVVVPPVDNSLNLQTQPGNLHNEQKDSKYPFTQQQLDELRKGNPTCTNADTKNATCIVNKQNPDGTYDFLNEGKNPITLYVTVFNEVNNYPGPGATDQQITDWINNQILIGNIKEFTLKPGEATKGIMLSTDKCRQTDVTTKKDINKANIEQENLVVSNVTNQCINTTPSTPPPPVSQPPVTPPVTQPPASTPPPSSVQQQQQSQQPQQQAQPQQNAQAKQTTESNTVPPIHENIPQIQPSEKKVIPPASQPAPKHHEYVIPHMLPHTGAGETQAQNHQARINNIIFAINDIMTHPDRRSQWWQQVENGMSGLTTKAFNEATEEIKAVERTFESAQARNTFPQTLSRLLHDFYLRLTA